MNNDDEHFGELLRNVPFDDAYRLQHRDDVCERALRAFDEAAAPGSITVADRLDPGRSRFTRRRVVQIAAIAAVAASVCAVMLVWQGSSRDPFGNHPPREGQIVRTEAQRRADENLLAALSQLHEIADDRAAATFDYGIEVCLMDHDIQIASMGQ